MVKVIFLDIDGVLNCSEPYAVFDRPRVHPHQVRMLTDLMMRTHARVVLISNWRLIQPLPVTENVLQEQGFPGVLVGCTGSALRTRGEEVKRWLEWSPPIERYVILDDRTDFYPDQVRVSPKTMVGMTETDWQVALELLLGDRNYAAAA